MGVETVAAEKSTQRKITRIGTVASDGMEKTVVARVEVLQKHPIYKKYMKRSKKYKVHDEKNECHVGDIIRFELTRPMSKSKCWKLVDIIARAK
jgi:small subunit ribosomal protein S17